MEAQKLEVGGCFRPRNLLTAIKEEATFPIEAIHGAPVPFTRLACISYEKCRGSEACLFTAIT